MHPLATQRLEQLDVADLTDASIKAATGPGSPFKVYASEINPICVEVAKRIATRGLCGVIPDAGSIHRRRARACVLPEPPVLATTPPRRNGHLPTPSRGAERPDLSMSEHSV